MKKIVLGLIVLAILVYLVKGFIKGTRLSLQGFVADLKALWSDTPAASDINSVVWKAEPQTQQQGQQQIANTFDGFYDPNFVGPIKKLSINTRLGSINAN